jgi:hypothetical protein
MPDPITPDRQAEPDDWAEPHRRARPDRRTEPDSRPLPDAVAIRSVVVPDAAPPYDDEPVAGPAQRRRVSTIRPPRPVQADRAQASPRPASRAKASPTQAGEPNTARTPGSKPRPGPGPVPAPVTGDWPSQFAQVLAETLAGSRPADQIATWTSEQARKQISQLGPVLAAAQRPRVRRVIVSSPARGVLEMTVIVGLGPRARAIAIRLEQASPIVGERSASDHPGTPGQPATRWLCTAVEAA